MLPRKKWLPVAFLVLLVQIILEAFALYRLIRLNMFPNRYILAAAGVLAIGIVITALLLFLGSGKGPKKSRRVRRIIAIILAIVLGVSSVLITTVANKLGNTVEKITESDKTPTAMIGVYVQKSDSAKKITDAKDYNFGIIGSADRTNTDKAIEDIDNVLSNNIATTEYTSMVELAEALYNGNSKAIILNEAYVDVLKETDQFANFSKDTRKIYEVPVYTKSAETAENNNAGSSSITEQPFTVYISGSDTRSQILTTSRSDVNILMTVNPKTKQILLLNTPRDYYVPNPVGAGAYDKLTHLGIYGIENSMEGLSELYNVKINYYAQINFVGFEKLVDAVGGVTVNSDVAFSADGYSFVQGNNNLDGKAALAFARDRHHQASGDNARGQHQMMIIEAVIQKINNSGSAILMNYSSILDSLSGMFVTNISSDDIAALVKQQLNEGGSWNVKSYAVTGQGGSDYTYSMPKTKAYVMYENKDMVQKGASLIDKVENGDTLQDSDVAN